MSFLRASLFGVCPSGLLAPPPRWIIGATATPEAGAKPLNRPWGGPGEDTTLTISAELEAKILRYFHVEKWLVGTIAQQLGVHHGTVDRVLS